MLMGETVQGQVDEMWVDSAEPAEVVTLADAQVARQLAIQDAAARGADYTKDLGNLHFLQLSVIHMVTHICLVSANLTACHSHTTQVMKAGKAGNSALFK
jgi:hypothetical protein